MAVHRCRSRHIRELPDVLRQTSMPLRPVGERTTAGGRSSDRRSGSATPFPLARGRVPAGVSGGRRRRLAGRALASATVPVARSGPATRSGRFFHLGQGITPATLSCVGVLHAGQRARGGVCRTGGRAGVGRGKRRWTTETQRYRGGCRVGMVCQSGRAI